MRLKNVHLSNFQCFEDSGEIPIYDMTIFIGENDCGKTALLRALDVFLNNKQIEEDIFHNIGDERANECRILLRFVIDEESISRYPKELVIKSNSDREEFTICIHFQ